MHIFICQHHLLRLQMSTGVVQILSRKWRNAIGVGKCNKNSQSWKKGQLQAVIYFTNAPFSKGMLTPFITVVYFDQRLGAAHPRRWLK